MIPYNRNDSLRNTVSKLTKKNNMKRKTLLQIGIPISLRLTMGLTIF
jgi:hypothetical protein